MKNPYDRFKDRKLEPNDEKGGDVMEKYFADLWEEQSGTFTKDVKSAIGIAYLKHIIVDEETAEKFVSGSADADYAVGMVHSGITEAKNDYHSFWEDVSKITGAYSNDDIKWLSENGNAAEMIDKIDPEGLEDSPVISTIRTNMKTYRK
ncbi:MAG: hypothetical protein HZB68_04340 [Candidatus Aenigmarchaeota archaeon]|nr:hypothetical protein [Candidatus Aenigmarchaeota archaeon]